MSAVNHTTPHLHPNKYKYIFFNKSNNLAKEAKEDDYTFFFGSSEVPVLTVIQEIKTIMPRYSMDTIDIIHTTGMLIKLMWSI